MLLGTRLWFAFFDAEHDDAPTFEERVDSVCRELGERGKDNTLGPTTTTMVSEGVPPTPAPAGGGATAVVAPSSTPAAAAGNRSFTPSIGAITPTASASARPSHYHTATPSNRASGGGGGEPMVGLDLAVLLREQVGAS